jgi:squalene-hopene/tetraprenyl-beta-curcumene cyclase
MKRINAIIRRASMLSVVWIGWILLAIPGQGLCKTLPSTQTDISLSKEISRSTALGYKFLKEHQNPDGSWSNSEFPALTGLVLYSFLTSPDQVHKTHHPEFIQKGLAYIASCAKPDGAIYKEKLPNYNTAICIMTLTAANDPKYYPAILKARRYIATLQEDRDQKGVADNPYDGGVGYGTKDHSDMSNTYMALEALRISEFIESDQHLKLYQDLKGMPGKTLNWDAAIKFIERCQNLPAYNDQAWASGDPKNKGGFVYFPGNSKAGEETLPDNKVALRSYGSTPNWTRMTPECRRPTNGFQKIIPWMKTRDWANRDCFITTTPWPKPFR